MGQGDGSAATGRSRTKRGSWRLAAAMLLLAALFLMNACATNPAVLRAEPAVLAQADQRGPTSTKSTLLYPRHYDRQRVQTLSEYVDQMISRMSVKDELGQLVVA